MVKSLAHDNILAVFKKFFQVELFPPSVCLAAAENESLKHLLGPGGPGGPGWHCGFLLAQCFGTSRSTTQEELMVWDLTCRVHSRCHEVAGLRAEIALMVSASAGVEVTLVHFDPSVQSLSKFPSFNVSQKVFLRRVDPIHEGEIQSCSILKSGVQVLIVPLHGWQEVRSKY